MGKTINIKQQRNKINFKKVFLFIGKNFPSILISMFAIGLISVTCIICYFQTINKTHFSDRFMEILAGSAIFLIVRTSIIMVKSHYNKNIPVK
ncbi:MAG: hypothetical protein C0448_09010 [Sphingobacteriaceae bacterium]|nr:hypothetical protein [Sphingobacteriaceae bacterium]